MFSNAFIIGLEHGLIEKDASIASKSLMIRLAEAGKRGGLKTGLLGKLGQRGMSKKEIDLLTDIAGASHLGADDLELLLVRAGRRPEVGMAGSNIGSELQTMIPGGILGGLVGSGIKGIDMLKKPTLSEALSGYGTSIPEIASAIKASTGGATLGNILTGPVGASLAGSAVVGSGVGMIASRLAKALATDLVRSSGAKRLGKRVASGKGLTKHDEMLQQALKEEFARIDPSMAGIAKREGGKVVGAGGAGGAVMASGFEV